MTDLWLISVPLDKTSSNSVEKLKRTLSKTNLASCCKFSIPDLKVRLFIICPSDEPNRLYRVAQVALYSLRQNFHLTHFTQLDLMSYVTKFQWDKAKYPTALPLSSLADIINKLINCTVCLSSGNMQTRSLNDIVRKEDLVVSEYLTTLLVVVTRSLYEDGEAGVFSVTLFKRAVCEFKAKAQESKFTVREYGFDLEEKKQQEMKQLSVHKKEQYGIFVCWLKVHFSEVFIAWIHLKGLRVFVESVLRYGLPVNYQALLLQTDRKRSKKVREELDSLFMHLDPTATASKTDVSCDIPGLCQQEYFSYICFHINTNVLEIS
uniref:V-type proton ATPase subunit C n=1 Tax=Seriola lalandi dorsalis TaxID=1841481 RepID=A0A3B4XSV7_SERLL